jgi:hypothetical protein
MCSGAEAGSLDLFPAPPSEQPIRPVHQQRRALAVFTLLAEREAHRRSPLS